MTTIAAASTSRFATTRRDARAFHLFADALGDGLVRLAAGDGTYPGRLHKAHRFAPDTPPAPAAVNTYDRTGTARVYTFDLDAKPTPGRTVTDARDQVARDITRLRVALRTAGLDFFIDRSPSGGYHLYVPVAGSLTKGDVDHADQLIERWLPSFDKMPHTSLTHGCIRIPGSPHRAGGVQKLVSPDAWALPLDGEAAEAELNRALTLLTRRPNHRQRWDTFVAALVDRTAVPHLAERATAGLRLAPAAIERPRAADLRDLEIAALPHLEPRTGRRTEPTGMWKRLAHEGHGTSVYATASQTRFAVLLSAVSAGMTALDVYLRAFHGDWPGLGRCYSRYGHAHVRASFKRDWLCAVAIEKQRRTEPPREPVQNGTTSGQETHAAPHSGWVRGWLEAAEERARVRGWSLGVRAVLAGLAFMSADQGSPAISVGNRSLAVAVNMDQASVGKILRRLMDRDSDPLISMGAEATGVYARELVLQMPDDDLGAGSRPWRRGPLHVVRPVFYALGHAAAFTYAALESDRTPGSARQIAQAAKLSPTTASAALKTLAEFDLARQTSDGWVLGSADAADVGERLGGEALKTARVVKHRAERREWHRWLGLIGPLDNTGMIADIEDFLADAAIPEHVRFYEAAMSGVDPDALPAPPPNDDGPAPPHEGTGPPANLQRAVDLARMLLGAVEVT